MYLLSVCSQHSIAWLGICHVNGFKRRERSEESTKGLNEMRISDLFVSSSVVVILVISGHGSWMKEIYGRKMNDFSPRPMFVCFVLAFQNLNIVCCYVQSSSSASQEVDDVKRTFFVFRSHIHHPSDDGDDARPFHKSCGALVSWCCVVSDCADLMRPEIHCHILTCFFKYIFCLEQVHFFSLSLSLHPIVCVSLNYAISEAFREYPPKSIALSWAFLLSWIVRPSIVSRSLFLSRSAWFTVNVSTGMRAKESFSGWASSCRRDWKLFLLSCCSTENVTSNSAAAAVDQREKSQCKWMKIRFLVTTHSTFSNLNCSSLLHTCWSSPRSEATRKSCFHWHTIDSGKK